MIGSIEQIKVYFSFWAQKPEKWRNQNFGFIEENALLEPWTSDGYDRENI